MAPKRNVGKALLQIALVLALSGFVLYQFRHSEPSYGGRSLTSWLAQLANPADERQAQAATEALRQIGTNAIPVLLKMMRCKDSVFKRALLTITGKQHILKFHSTDATHEHLCAFLGFAALGPLARPALPDLETLVGNPNTSRFAAKALAEIGQDGVRAVAAALQNTNAIVRREVAGALGSLGVVRFTAKASPERLQMLRAHLAVAIPSLVAACADPDELVRARSATALGLLGLSPELALPVLAKLLTESNGRWRVPSAAAKALGRFGPEAASAIPALNAALQNNDVRVRQAAESALRAIQKTYPTEDATQAQPSLEPGQPKER